jgi:hypothetical protein
MEHSPPAEARWTLARNAASMGISQPVETLYSMVPPRKWSGVSLCSLLPARAFLLGSFFKLPHLNGLLSSLAAPGTALQILSESCTISGSRGINRSVFGRQTGSAHRYSRCPPAGPCALRLLPLHRLLRIDQAPEDHPDQGNRHVNVESRVPLGPPGVSQPSHPVGESPQKDLRGNPADSS